MKKSYGKCHAVEKFSPFTTSIWKTLRVYHTFHSTTTIMNIKLNGVEENLIGVF